MRGEVLDTLRRWLMDDVRVVEGLSDQDLEALHTALTTARRRQARALQAASDEALRQMPTLLRNTIGKMVGR